ncbi:MAG: endopeptidase La [Phycisphaerae bacterium]|nr:endopeptidase La [Phycisphaerae bacterium]
MDPALKLHEMVEVDSAEAPEPVKPEDASRPFALPATIPILPIRSAVAFPGTVMPLAIGRARSKQLMKDVVPHQTIFGLVAQKNPDTEDPGPDDLYRVGTAASVLKIIQMPQGSLNVIVHAITRFQVVEFIGVKPYIKARVRPLEVTVKRSKKLLALMMNVKAIATRVIHLSPNVPDEAANLLESIDDASALADFLSATLAIPVPEKQSLLEQTDANKRLERISVALANQLEVLELSHKIQGQIRDSIDKSQREYFLQEELKAIQAELGEADKRTQEINELNEKIKKAAMPEKVQKAALEELDRLGKIPLGTPEYGVIRTYLDWMCDLPWSRSTEDSLDIRRAERILNRDHFGLEKVKRRILEFLAVRKLNPKGKSPILCFVGPPGVGKTSLGQSIARAMSRKFVRISLGGIRDEADIRGHRRTYIGALPGRILQELKKCSVRNPVFMLDEMDKIGQDFRGDPASALLEVLDPQQNHSFTDHYLDQPFNLADVMFIGTANFTEPIPPALEDRMEIIELPGYTDREKMQIAKRYLIPRQLKENGLTTARLRITDAALDRIIHDFTREAGVRNLERSIASVCRFVAARVAKGRSRAVVTVEPAALHKILGPRRFDSELAQRTSTPGVATGLAWTPVGGELLFVESVAVPGKGTLTLTGHIGDVMKESAQAAFSVVRSLASEMKIDPDRFKKSDFHIHVPAGAVPKDGPSAGIAIFTSLVSLLTNRTVQPTVAMTGEITLKGLVLPIGGLKEKILAAKRSGITTVILPQRNKKDLVEVPKEARRGMSFVFVSRAKDTLKFALR